MENNLTLTWEETVILEIEHSCKSSFGIVDDPDNIVSEQVLSALLERGWLVTSVTDPLELRYEYEDQIRQDPSVLPERKIFIIRFPFVYISFDIQNDADKLQLTLKQFFPNLSYNVLRSLPAFWRPVIFNNQSERLIRRQPLDDTETVNFIIRDCLGLDYAPNPTFEDVLSLLADIALHKLEIPTSLKSVLLSQSPDLTVRPLYDYIDTPVKAGQFLQVVWQQYIQYKLSKNLSIAEGIGNEVTKSVISLDKNREFQTKVTALIAENILQPVNIFEEALLPDWLKEEVHYYQDKTIALQEKLDSLSTKLPGERASFNDWVEFAFQWANWKLDYHQLMHSPPDVHYSFEILANQLDQNYFKWLEQQYPSLVMQSYLPTPTCVHHVLNHINSTFHPSSSHPVALVVVDGMAIQDWIVLQSEWLNANLAWHIDEKGLLAFVPTLTSVSRQALLSAKLPRYFEKSWLNTINEELYWRSFWEEQDLNANTIAYVKGLGGQYNTGDSDLVLEASVEEILRRPHLSIAAFIVNTIDELVHTSVLGEREFNSRLRHWAIDTQYLRVLVSRLFQRFDTVIVTSDHGHIAGKGIGDLSLSSVAEERSMRARIFKGKEFEKLVVEIPDIAIWQKTGLPPDVVVILPKGRGLFAKEGYFGISHGGASFEETIVPYVTITK